MDSAHTGETTQQPAARHSSLRDLRRIAPVAVVVLAAAWLVAFIVSNSQTVKVSFVFGDVSLSLIWAMIICAALGALLAFSFPRLLRWRRRRA